MYVYKVLYIYIPFPQEQKKDVHKDVTHSLSLHFLAWSPGSCENII